MGKIYNNVTSVICNILFDLLFIFLQYNTISCGLSFGLTSPHELAVVISGLSIGEK